MCFSHHLTVALKSVASSNRASAGKRYGLTFDFASFATGLVAGGLVGVLAGYLHEMETIGELQERVRTAMLQFERVSSGMRDGGGRAYSETGVTAAQLYHQHRVLMNICRARTNEARTIRSR